MRVGGAGGVLVVGLLLVGLLLIGIGGWLGGQADAGLGLTVGGLVLLGAVLGRDLRPWEDVHGAAKVGLGLVALGAGGLLPLLAEAGGGPAGVSGPALAGVAALRVVVVGLALMARRGQPWVGCGGLALFVGGSLRDLTAAGLVAGVDLRLAAALAAAGLLAIAGGRLLRRHGVAPELLQ